MLTMLRCACTRCPGCNGWLGRIPAAHTTDTLLVHEHPGCCRWGHVLPSHVDDPSRRRDMFTDAPAQVLIAPVG